jgi:hypothetical protein
MSYRKGEQGENEVCQFLTENDLIEAQRNLSERRSGDKGDLDTNLPVQFEIKAKKQPSVWKAVEQAQEASELTERGDYSVAFLRRKNGRGKESDRLVAMPWDDFREIAEKLVAEGIW